MNAEIANELIQSLFDATSAIRYVALLQGSLLVSSQRPGVHSASASESDRYEELLVNPTILTAVRQRGEIDCGGLQFLIVAYGNFYQLVQPCGVGHISVCIDLAANPVQVQTIVERIIGNNSHFVLV